MAYLELEKSHQPGSAQSQLIGRMTSKADRAFIRRVNAQTVDPKDMGAVLLAADELEPEHRCFEALVGVAADLLSHRSMDYTMALMFRLEALNVILKDLDMPGLANPGDNEGAILVPEWSVVAACKCKLIAEGKTRVSFDVEEFRTAAINAAPAEGSA
jgi:hypothetical protein